MNNHILHPLEEMIDMFDAIRIAAHADMNDTELAAALVDRCPTDDNGPLFWA